MQKLKGMPEGFGVLYATSKYPTLLYKVQHFLRYEIFLKFLFYHYFLSHLVLKKPFKNECHYDKKLSWSNTIRFTLLVCLCTIQYLTSCMEPKEIIRSWKERNLLVINSRWLGGEGGGEKRLLDMPLATPGM